MGILSSKPRTKIVSRKPALYILKNPKEFRKEVLRLVSRLYRLRKLVKIKKTRSHGWQKQLKREWRLLKKYAKKFSPEDNYSQLVSFIKARLLMIRSLIQQEEMAKGELELINKIVSDIDKSYRR